LPLLHLIQEYFGFIEDQAIEWVAHKLELEPINVLELVTFYPMFQREPLGKHHIRVCRTLSCAMAGGYQLLDTFCKHANIVRERSEHGDHLFAKSGSFSRISIVPVGPMTSIAISGMVGTRS
jgi:NADH-quinone oxidoreductase subunit E